MSSPSFAPFFDILPKEQQICWEKLNAASEAGFVLYGGTALALRLGHRLSVDFDFFSPYPLNRARIFETFAFLQDAQRLQDNGDTLTLKVNEPSFSLPVKISFFGQIDFGRVGVPEYADGSRILVASLDDIMALKLKVMLQRIEAKDYIDIAAMIRHGVSLEKGLASAELFFGTRFSPAIALDTLVWFEGLETLAQQERQTLIGAVADVGKNIHSLPEVTRKPSLLPEVVGEIN